MISSSNTLMTSSDPLEAALDGRPYQRTAVNFIAANRNVLVADQPGLGKTIEILAGIRASWDRPIRVLILCPRVAVTSVWAREIEARLDPRRVVVLPLQGKGTWRTEMLHNLLAIEPPYESSVFVIGNIEMARIKPERDGDRVKWLPANALYPDLFSITWDVVVIDESDRALIAKSRLPKKWSQQYAGMKMLQRLSHQRIAASGTPMRGKPEQLWGTLNWLRPKDYPGYWKWVNTYFETSGNHFTTTDSIVGGLVRPNQLATDLLGVMIRRTKAEVLPELPPIQYGGQYLYPRDEQSPHGVWLEMSDKQRRQYATMLTDGVLITDDAEIIANGVLAQDARKMQIANAECVVTEGTVLPTLDSPKYEWLLGKIDELDGERLIVSSKSTRLIDVFAAGLRQRDIACHVITGKVTSDKRRAAMVDDFQSADPAARVFLLNTKAGGVALTLDMSDYGVSLDRTGNPDDETQMEGRAHRTSRIHSVTWWYLQMLDTIEEEIALVSAARGNVQQYLLDGSRGVEFARKMYQESKQNR